MISEKIEIKLLLIQAVMLLYPYRSISKDTSGFLVTLKLSEISFLIGRVEKKSDGKAINSA